jgi:branched-chain amino acid aminotransferase
MADPASVLTFESSPGGATLRSRVASLAASSAELPEGAYTTLRTYHGRRVLRLDRHFDRLEESVALQGRPARVDRAAARLAITAALDATGFPESRVRLTFAPPRLFVAVGRFEPLPPHRYENGVACITVPLLRENPHAKDTRFIATAQSVYARLPPEIEEGLLVAEDGCILEGLSSNFFAVLAGVLRTEDERVLAGITRAVVLEIAAGVVPVERRPVGREQLGQVSEAFITSVSREVLPVVCIDDRAVGDGRVGPAARAIVRGFTALVEREAEPL